MSGAVFVSTSCLKRPYGRLDTLIQAYAEASIEHIELGAVSGCTSFDISPRFFNRGIRFLVHNYFPPPSEPFVLNLASQNQILLDRSIDLCKRAIDLCVKLGASGYSVHAGFCGDIEPDALGDPFLSYSNVVPHEIAYQTFVTSLRTLARYARARNVKLCVEPNVLQESILRHGKNEIALICESREVHGFMSDMADDGIGILLDTGHLNVTAKTLGLDRLQFAKEVAPYVRALHVHDNDGVIDSHRPVQPGSWVFDVLALPELSQLPIIVEAKFDTIDDIRRHVDWLKEERKSSR